MKTPWKILSLTVLGGFALALFSGAAIAKKPDRPPKPDPGEEVACADAGSFFPAFAYEAADRLFLSNAEGDCTLFIYEAEGVGSLHFRFQPSEGASNTGTAYFLWKEQYTETVKGRRVWTPIRVMMAEIALVDGHIADPLPLAPRELLTGPAHPVGALLYPVLSHDANRVYITGQAYLNGTDDLEGTVSFIDEIVLAPPQAVDPVLERDRILEKIYYPPSEAGLVDTTLAPGGDRLYFRWWPHHDANGELDWTSTLFYLEREGDGWSAAPTPVIESEKAFYFDVGLWDYDCDGNLERVAAHALTVLDFDELEILDIDACAAAYPDTSGCLLTGSNSGTGVVIEGDKPSFTSFSTGTTPSAPALLYTIDLTTKTGSSIAELELTVAHQGCDLVPWTTRILVPEGNGDRKNIWMVDSAD